MNEKRAFWNTAITFGPIFGIVISAGAVAANDHPLFFLLATLLVYSVGIFLFLKAKFSVISNGYLVSFGPSLMTPVDQTIYKAGYALMGVGSLLAIDLLSIPH